MNSLRTTAKPLTRVSQLASLTRRFSTEAQQPQPPPPQQPQPSPAVTFDPFHQAPPSGSGPIFARLSANSGGIGKYTTKSDVMNLLPGSNLTADDIKHEYDNYLPVCAHVRLSSREAYDVGVKSVARKSRYRLFQEDSSHFESIMPYDGKAVLLEGLPRNSIAEDVSRFLAGCPHISRSVRLIIRGGAYPMKIALVHFPSQALAMHAFITKNRAFCLNTQITVRVLY